MYLSKLTLNPQHRVVLAALADCHKMHRLLMMALPDAGEGGAGRCLYRVEEGVRTVSVLVQTEKEPDWARLAALLLHVDGPKPVSLRDESGKPKLSVGTQLRFRLRANPTQRKMEYAEKRSAANGRTRTEGKRLAIVDASGQVDWLTRKAASCGFILSPLPQGSDWFDPFPSEETKADVRIIPQGKQTGVKRNGISGAQRLTHCGILFEGVLTVADPEALTNAIEFGIGSAKGFGFGLLSLARP